MKASALQAFAGFPPPAGGNLVDAAEIITFKVDTNT
jgi:hypothetical protein